MLKISSFILEQTKLECGQSYLKITVDIKCLKCKIEFKNTSEFRNFVVNIEGNMSVKDAFGKFFENEIVEKYNCIGCMESVLASKKWKILNTPEELCLLLRYHRRQPKARNITFDRDLILKCSNEGGVRYWKYELASVTSHTGLNHDREPLQHSPCKLVYERIEVIFSR